MRKKFLVLSMITMVATGVFSGCNTKTVEPVKVEAAEKSVEVGSFKSDSLDFYRELSEEIGAIEIIDSADLSLEDLENRNGRILNCADPDYYYISYRSVEDFQEGDTILTYFIYNPDTNYTDDILERFDYVIDREEN